MVAMGKREPDCIRSQVALQWGLCCGLSFLGTLLCNYITVPCSYLGICLGDDEKTASCCLCSCSRNPSAGLKSFCTVIDVFLCVLSFVTCPLLVGITLACDLLQVGCICCTCNCLCVPCIHYNCCELMPMGKHIEQAENLYSLDIISGSW